MRLSSPDPTPPKLDFDASVFFDKVVLSGSEELATDLLQILRDNGIKKRSDQETALMVAILPLIVKRDEVVFNHAFKAGRASV